MATTISSSINNASSHTKYPAIIRPLNSHFGRDFNFANHQVRKGSSILSNGVVSITKNCKKNGIRSISMVWQDSKARMEVDVPASLAYELWSDRERMNRWMPWITSIKVNKDQPDVSQWNLTWNAFGMDLNFSWSARNMQPIPNQKIHWYSLDGLPNKGVVRFYPKGQMSCVVEVNGVFVNFLAVQLLSVFSFLYVLESTVQVIDVNAIDTLQMTVSFEVPAILSGVTGIVSSSVEGILEGDLKRFAAFAKNYSSEVPTK